MGFARLRFAGAGAAGLVGLGVLAGVPAAQTSDVNIQAIFTLVDTNADQIVTEDEFLRFHAPLFAVFDQNRDGAIARAEFDRLANRRPNLAQLVFAVFDTDGNGQVNRAEYDRYYQGQFATLDTDRDGGVTLAEATAAAAAAGGTPATDGAAAPSPAPSPIPSPTQTTLRIFDSDGSGFIEEIEFLSAYNHQFFETDLNRDGVATLAELRTVSGGAVTATDQAYFNGVDANRDGTATIPEFRAFHRRNFQSIDVDRDRRLTAQEVQLGINAGFIAQ